MILEAAREIKHKNEKNTGFLHSPEENAVLKCIVANGDCLCVCQNDTTVLTRTLRYLHLLVLGPLETCSNS